VIFFLQNIHTFLFFTSLSSAFTPPSPWLSPFSGAICNGRCWMVFITGTSHSWVGPY
jgi:hypothetical protein